MIKNTSLSAAAFIFPGHVNNQSCSDFGQRSSSSPDKHHHLLQIGFVKASTKDGSMTTWAYRNTGCQHCGMQTECSFVSSNSLTVVRQVLRTSSAILSRAAGQSANVIQIAHDWLRTIRIQAQGGLNVAYRNWILDRDIFYHLSWRSWRSFREITQQALCCAPAAQLLAAAGPHWMNVDL